MPPRSTAIPLLVVSCLHAHAIALAQAPVRLGAEFQINTRTVNRQITAVNRSLDFESNGDFVVVWTSVFQDGSLEGVFGQRFASSGARLGAEFLVNSFTLNAQDYAAVALDADGDFVVAWRSLGLDGSERAISARRFDSSGVALGSDFLVNTITSGEQRNPAVARDADGDFVITWSSQDQDGAGYGVFGRRFNSSGVAQGSEFQINTHTVGSELSPAIDLAQNGDFVVTWESSAQDGNGYGVFGQRFNSLGARQGPEFQVNTYVTNVQRGPAIGLDADGDFVVVWQSYGQSGTSFGVFGRRFDSSGTPLGAEMQIDTYGTAFQGAASIGVDADGDFVVAWQSLDQDGDALGVFARHFRSTGVPTTGELPVNTTTASDQLVAAARCDVDGDFLVAWASDEQDGGLHGVFGQRFDVPALLDIDGNGQLTPLTDGLLVLRFLFGFTGATLTAGAVGASCTRCDASAILPHLQSLT